MADFYAAYGKTNAREGMVLSNVATDRGGMTFGGISRKHHPLWSGWSLIDSGDREGAKLLALHRMFFMEEFWDPLKLDELTDQEIAEKLYDTAVNCGTSRAATWIQNALNAANQQGREWPDLIVDNRIGARTIELINKLSGKPKRRWLVLQIFETQQEYHYFSLAQRDPTQEANLLGWYTHRIHHREEA